MSSSVHGSLGPSGRTRSKQKRLGDPIERERRARPLSFFYFAVCCYHSFWTDEWLFFFLLQSKRKSDPKKGKSQSSAEDVVWFSFIHAFCRLLFIRFSSAVYLWCPYARCLCCCISLFFFRRKFHLLRLRGLWRKKWLQWHLKVWKRRPLVVALLRGLVSQYRVSRSTRILRLSNFLRSKIPNSSRLLVL